MDEYYDYVIRNEEDLIRHLQYIHNNPVKRGLVETTEQYLWSSANPNFENDLENTLSGSGLRRELSRTDEPDYLLTTTSGILGRSRPRIPSSFPSPAGGGQKKSQKEISEKPFSCHPSEFIDSHSFITSCQGLVTH